MLDEMVPGPRGGANLLILDSCGERASLALFRGELLQAALVLEERTASATLLGAMRGMLKQQQLPLSQLGAIGVVSGPGSFTGIRVGLALAKGFCEATGLPLAAVSRLAVLAEAGELREGVAALAAGRDQVYLRMYGGTEDGREQLAGWADFLSIAGKTRLILGSPDLHARLAEEGISADFIEPLARHALQPVLRCLEAGGSDLSTSDANYVRNEESIYPAKPAALARGTVGG